MNFNTEPVSWECGCRPLPGEVQGLGSDVDGARAADLGGHGGSGRGMGRHHRGGASDRDLSFHDSARAPGVEDEAAARARTDPASGRWPQEGGRHRSNAPGRSRGPGGADRLGRSHVAAALDLEKPPAARGESPGHGPSGEPAIGGRAVGGGGLREGASHPDRDAQFRYINQQVRRFQAATQPVISVDTKKKELVGDFKNAGRQWRPTGQPEPVRVHDFIIPTKGKAIPYGVYDLTRNAGWVSVGVDHDTATFAVRTIGRWWQKMGRPRYRRARSLLITADAGGSNGPRVRLWKWALQRLATRTHLAITVCHLPPGTSKWNKIEHRLFSYISTNWRGQPLVSLAVIVNLIGATRTATGLRVRCELDRGAYPKGQDVTDGQMAMVNLEPHRFHGDWNYTIRPNRGRH